MPSAHMLARLFAAIAPLLVLAGCGPSAGGGGGDGQGAASPATETAARAEALAREMPDAFLQCRGCHTIAPGQNAVGPSLFGIVGSKAGDVPGYSFSPALKASGIVWTPDKLDEWLQGPMKMVPGTRMVVAIPDPARRKAIIDYLEKLK